jgi:hypothetical protein
MKNTILVCVTLLLIVTGNLSAQLSAVQPDGDGSSGNPYQIATLGNLYWMMQNSGSWSSDFIQTADIDASSSNGWNSGTGIIPIGNSTTEFTGSYDGQGYTIAGIFYSDNSQYHVGLFGVAQGGTIRNLGVVNVNISASAYVGGLVGTNVDSVINCYSTGSVTGVNAWDGGLVGEGAGTISKSYSAAHVSGSVWVGGLIGGALGNIDNSYAIGSVHGGGAGGLAGKVFSNVTITNCYAAAAVNGFDLGGLVADTTTANGVTIVNSFWDVQTSGQSTSVAGGTGDSTAAMQTQSTFTGACWDFTTIWTINADSNRGYPFLQGVMALPVELVSFTASLNQGTPELQWKTATEVNNAGFEVERTINNQQLTANNWSKVGFVSGAGTSNSPHNYSFTDKVGTPGTYSYRLKQIDRNGAFTYSRTITLNAGGAPNVFALGQNYPNPFNPSTTIQFTVPADGRTTLKVFNTLGEEVATLFDGPATAGEYHQAMFDASRLASGIYFSRLEFNGKTQVKKMMLVK